MMSYKELKSLDVKEFFILLVNYERQMNEKGELKETKGDG